jgi:selenide,water dikinase
LTNGKAEPGDRLVLTKPLGTGIIATALKGGLASGEAVKKIIASMTALNRKASELMRTYEAHACTDITGFGFIGHAMEMVLASRVGMVIESKNIPVFPEAIEYARLGLIPGGAHSNRDFFSCRVNVGPNVPGLLIDLLYDPQTSGGLLIALPSNEAERLVEALKKDGEIHSSIVGKVIEEPQGKIQVD